MTQHTTKPATILPMRTSILPNERRVGNVVFPISREWGNRKLESLYAEHVSVRILTHLQTENNMPSENRKQAA